MQANESDPTVKAGRREWLGLVVLALPALLLSVDMSVLFLALPHLAQDIQPTSSEQLWIVDIYGFMLAGFLVTMGTLGDRIGRRKLMLIGGAAFGVASVLAAFSTSPEMLIAARALLGLAGATLAPSTLALIFDMFKNPKERASAIAVWSSCFVGGNVLGPVIGGLMLSWAWWGSVFLLAVPVMVLLLIAGPVLLPEQRNPNAGKLDLFSVALSLLAVIPVMYGIKEFARTGWSFGTVAVLVAGVAIGVLFVRRQRKLADPLLDLGLFKIGVLRSTVALGLLTGVILGGTLMLVTLQLQMVEGLSSMAAGFWIVPGVTSTIIAIQVGTRLARKYRPAKLIASGLVVSAVGFVILSQVDSGDSLPLIVTGLVLANLGLGPLVGLGYGIVLGAAPPEKVGSASALSESSGEFGLAAGIAVMGSIGTAIYHAVLTLPDGLPGDVAASARESIADALAAANGLADTALAGELVAAVREAFTAGLNFAGVLAAVAFLGFALISWKSYKHLPPTGDTPDGAEEAPAEEPEKVAEPGA